MTHQGSEVAGLLQQQIDAVGARPLLNRLGEVSPHTLAHSLRLGQLACDVGLEEYALSAALHDNGKIDGTVLRLIESSSNRLNTQQRNRISKHAIYGRRNIQDLDTHYSMVEQARMAEFVARHHHDSPDKLVALQARRPELAPLIDATIWTQVADIWDAVRDPNRPYRAPASIEEATDIVLEGREGMLIGRLPIVVALHDIQKAHVQPELIAKDHDQADFEKAA